MSQVIQYGLNTQSIHFTEKQIAYFWENVIKTDKCWYWIGKQTKLGYGTFFGGNPTTLLFAHRISYQLTVGKIPTAKPELDHYCHVRNCVNPSHLLPTDRSGNLRNRRKWFRKTLTVRTDVNKLGNCTGGYTLEGTQEYIRLARTHCSRGHKIRYLKLEGTGDKMKCVDCIDDKERLDLRNWEKIKDEESEESRISLDEFYDNFNRKFSNGTAKKAVELKLREHGIKTQTKRVLQAERYIEMFFDEKKVNLKMLADKFGLEKRTTRLSKNKDMIYKPRKKYDLKEKKK